MNDINRSSSVAIDMVTVGNPGNAADSRTGYGAVGYAYQIGKYEVTIQQYTDFLNAVAASDPYGLYSQNMATDLAIAGISRSGLSGSYTYSVIGPSGETPDGASSPGNRPIAYISWFDAARFANWMHNGQGSGSTETGAYTLLGATSGNAVPANPGARFYIPTQDEWYKAAFYSPQLNFYTGGYYAFPTQRGLSPASGPGNTIGMRLKANQANYYDGDFTVTQALTLSSLNNQNYLTEVGAFTNSASFYGTFDQGGNIYEWTDEMIASSQRRLRGGFWMSNVADLSYLDYYTTSPLYEFDGSGFRLASPVVSPVAGSHSKDYGNSKANNLTNGLGGDTVRSSTALDATSNRDQITDFKSDQGDRIQLKNPIFTAQPTTGTLDSAAFRASSSSVAIDMVTVGNPGNAADSRTGYGAVGYAYQIGKYEVTIQQYTDFLNAVAASDPYGLYNQNMGTDLTIAGISRSGLSGSYTYSVIGPSGETPDGASSPGNRPIAYISWFDAARFANWMHNGQGAGSTETGAYTLLGATSGNAVSANPGAQFYIPTQDEWYKAAFYSPQLNFYTGGYYVFATQRNSTPDSIPGNTIGMRMKPNQSNYFDGGFTVTQLVTPSTSQNYLTDVGAFTNSASFYGTFDQGGNLYEWVDEMGIGPQRSVRGGYWVSNVADTSYLDNYILPVSYESNGSGFRLASPVAGCHSKSYGSKKANDITGDSSAKKLNNGDGGSDLITGGLGCDTVHTLDSAAFSLGTAPTNALESILSVIGGATIFATPPIGLDLNNTHFIVT